MGLDIKSKNKSYHAGYRALYLVRWLALIDCGFPEEIQGKSSVSYYPNAYIFSETCKAPNAPEFSLIMVACQLAGFLYPNLLLHSDCEGEYTRGGEPVQDNNWFTGNLLGLRDELECLSKNLKEKHKVGRPWEIFNTLNDVVIDAVKTGRKKIIFF